MYSLVSRPFARVGYKFIQLEADECKKCKMKEECPKIWRTYVGVVGGKEFKAIH